MGVHAHALKRSTRRCVGMALESRIINFRNGYILFGYWDDGHVKSMPLKLEI